MSQHSLHRTEQPALSRRHMSQHSLHSTEQPTLSHTRAVRVQWGSAYHELTSSSMVVYSAPRAIALVVAFVQSLGLWYGSRFSYWSMMNPTSMPAGGGARGVGVGVAAGADNKIGFLRQAAKLAPGFEQGCVRSGQCCMDLARAAAFVLLRAASYSDDIWMHTGRQQVHVRQLAHQHRDARLVQTTDSLPFENPHQDDCQDQQHAGNLWHSRERNTPRASSTQLWRLL